MFKMRIYFFCMPLSKKPARVYDEISFDCELPYIPQVGGAISVTENQDVAEIDEVIYCPYHEDEYERITVHLKPTHSLDEFETLAAEGWKSA